MAVKSPFIRLRAGVYETRDGKYQVRKFGLIWKIYRVLDPAPEKGHPWEEVDVAGTKYAATIKIEMVWGGRYRWPEVVRKEARNGGR